MSVFNVQTKLSNMVFGCKKKCDFVVANSKGTYQPVYVTDGPLFILCRCSPFTFSKKYNIMSKVSWPILIKFNVKHYQEREKVA